MDNIGNSVSHFHWIGNKWVGSCCSVCQPWKYSRSTSRLLQKSRGFLYWEHCVAVCSFGTFLMLVTPRCVPFPADRVILPVFHLPLWDSPSPLQTCAPWQLHTVWHTVLHVLMPSKSLSFIQNRRTAFLSGFPALSPVPQVVLGVKQGFQTS